MIQNGMCILAYEMNMNIDKKKGLYIIQKRVSILL